MSTGERSASVSIPVALGVGLSLFKDLAGPLVLRLVQATTYDTAALHVYRPAHQPRRKTYAGTRSTPKGKDRRAAAS